MARPDREIERGRALHAKRAWADAHASLSAADRKAPLGAGDLELLAATAYMLGRPGEHVRVLERAYDEHRAAGDGRGAARCAFWAGLNLALRGEGARATGWFGRGQRLVDSEERDCPERGYLLIPALFQAYAAGKHADAYGIATEVAALADRLGDRDLLAIAVHEQGHALLEQDRVEEGLRLLDEAMIMVTADELSPIVTGLIYCSVLGYCQEVFALRRAREWTAALSDWCEAQPDLVSFTGRCLIHRAEILQMGGAWSDALAEARRVEERFAETLSRRAAAEATYRRGELHRLRGELESAEDAYREASRGGWDPQPGLALLRLAQGEGAAALAAICRVLAGTTEPRRRAALLPACVEITLAAGEVDEAEVACSELEEIAAAQGRKMLKAMAGYARGAVCLARGDAGGALASLRRASEAWHELDVPYEIARSRVLAALACRELGDEDAVAMELEAARGLFAQLCAAPEVARVDALSWQASAGPPHGLTERELEVLRLVATGQSNREIGAALFISEHTVARHLQNIFAKLQVSSRTAASAVALRQGIV